MKGFVVRNTWLSNDNISYETGAGRYTGLPYIYSSASKAQVVANKRNNQFKGVGKSEVVPILLIEDVTWKSL